MLVGPSQTPAATPQTANTTQVGPQPASQQEQQRQDLAKALAADRMETDKEIERQKAKRALKELMSKMQMLPPGAKGAISAPLEDLAALANSDAGAGSADAIIKGYLAQIDTLTLPKPRDARGPDEAPSLNAGTQTTNA